MSLVLLLNWRVWAAAFVALGLAASHWKVYKLGESGSALALSEYKLGQARQTLRLVEQRDAVTQTLQVQSDNERKKKNETIARLNTDLAAALDSVRNRPERPSAGGLSAPPAAGAESSCTGAGLWGTDARFLVWFASRTQHLRADLAECQAKYSNAVEALNQ